MYKIMRMTDGKYSNGGMCPRFTKRGKIWQTMGDVKRHFSLIQEYSKYQYHYRPCDEFPYKDCRIVLLLTQEIFQDWIKPGFVLETQK